MHSVFLVPPWFLCWVWGTIALSLLCQPIPLITWNSTTLPAWNSSTPVRVKIFVSPWIQQWVSFTEVEKERG